MSVRIKHRNDESEDTTEPTISSGECQWLKEQIKSTLLLCTSHKSLGLSPCHSADIMGHPWGENNRQVPNRNKQGHLSRACQRP